MISQRKKLFWPAAILLILAAYICFNNFVFHQAAKEKLIEEVVKTITVDDLIAMVFWEKDNAQHIRKEILEERRNGQRDQERLAYSLQETIFFFNLWLARLLVEIDVGNFPSHDAFSWAEKDGTKRLKF